MKGSIWIAISSNYPRALLIATLLEADCPDDTNSSSFLDLESYIYRKFAHKMQRDSSISLSHIPMVLFGAQNSEDDAYTSRRVSSASTASSHPSLPRTPSSAHETANYHWRDSRHSDVDRLASLREAFDNKSEYNSSPDEPITPERGIINVDVERSGWNVAYKSPVRSLSVLSPTSAGSTERKHRVVRSASSASQSSVRLWPQRPPVQRDPVIEEEISRLSLYNDEDSDPTKEDEDVSQPSESDDAVDATLRRRRHIRRPARAKQDTPRRLPPLPGTLVHSHSTAARYAAVPGPSPGQGWPGTSQSSVAMESVFDELSHDSRRRSHTISGFQPSRIRPLPVPANRQQEQQRPQPPPSTAPKAKLPRLRLATLSPTDPAEANEANAVLTKTPNRRFHPLGFGGGAFVAPPMPQDAGSRLDWELIEDLLEAGDELDADDAPTPIARPLPRQGAN